MYVGFLLSKFLAALIRFWGGVEGFHEEFIHHFIDSGVFESAVSGSWDGAAFYLYDGCFLQLFEQGYARSV